MIRNWDFNCKDFGRCIDWLRLGIQKFFTAIIINFIYPGKTNQLV